MLPGPDQSSFTCKSTAIPLLIIHPATKSLLSPCDERQGKACWSVTFRIRNLKTLFKIRSERSWKQLWSNSLCRERPFWTSYLLVMLLICHGHDLIKSILFSVNFEHSPLFPVAWGSGPWTAVQGSFMSWQRVITYLSGHWCGGTPGRGRFWLRHFERP